MVRIFISIIICLTVCCSAAFASDADQSLSLGAAYGIARFSTDSPYQTNNNITIGINYQFHSRTSFHVSATQLNTNQPVDTPQGTEDISSRFHLFSFQLMGKFFSLPLLGDFNLGGGTGFVNIKQEAFEVSLGALGTTKIPSQKDQHFLYTVTSSLSRPIGPRFAAVLSAKVHFLTLEEQQNMYTISGGVNVRLW